MAKRKSSISNATSYEEIGEFWDTHDTTDYADQTHEVEFELDEVSVVVNFPSFTKDYRT